MNAVDRITVVLMQSVRTLRVATCADVERDTLEMVPAVKVLHSKLHFSSSLL